MQHAPLLLLLLLLLLGALQAYACALLLLLLLLLDPWWCWQHLPPLRQHLGIVHSRQQEQPQQPIPTAAAAALTTSWPLKAVLWRLTGQAVQAVGV
jgi:hypothetical protein